MVYHDENYSHTPFLCFIVGYFTKAVQRLDIAEFYADEYYAYLARHLQGKGTKKGVFQLIREGTPLTDHVGRPSNMSVSN